MSFRKEEKLRINKNQLLNLLDWVNKNGGNKLYASRIVSSTYFDNDSLAMFKDSEEGSVPRKKIRIRSYSKIPHTLDSSSLEIKISSVEGRYKTATKFESITFSDAINKNLRVMDSTAISLAKESKIPILITNINRENSILDAINGIGKYSKIS